MNSSKVCSLCSMEQVQSLLKRTPEQKSVQGTKSVPCKRTHLKIYYLFICKNALLLSGICSIVSSNSSFSFRQGCQCWALNQDKILLITLTDKMYGVELSDTI